MTEQVFEMDHLVVDSSGHSISSNGTTCRLEPRLMKLVVLMASRPGCTISRTELLATGWEEAPYVSDEALTKGICEIRKVLRDLSPGSRFIDTVPKKGYRLIANIQTRDDKFDSCAVQTVPDHPGPQHAPERPHLERAFRALTRRVSFAVLLIFILSLATAASVWMDSGEQTVRVRKLMVPAHAAGLPNAEEFATALQDTTIVVEDDELDALLDRWAIAESQSIRRVVAGN